MTHQVQIQGTDVSFACAAGDTLLDAAARSGIELPYSCRKGVCGNCKGRVLSGALVAGTAGGGAEAGIDAADEHLFCRAQAGSDLVIEPRSWHRLDPAARKTFSAKVFKKTLVASDVTVLHLRLPAGLRAKFQAGQYLQVLLPDGQRRAYSMANPPHESDGLQLHIRHEPGGHFSSGVLPALQVGDMLQVELPHGDFWFREDSGRPVLMVATGTGLAPLKSIIDHMLRKKLQLPLRLDWSARTPEGFYAAEQIQRWQRQLPGFHYQAVMRQAAPGMDPAIQVGQLEDIVARDLPDLQGWDVYACGAPAMVQALRQRCTHGLGLPAAQFHSDAFVPSTA